MLVILIKVRYLIFLFMSRILLREFDLGFSSMTPGRSKKYLFTSVFKGDIKTFYNKNLSDNFILV